jgi:hypothetical protein
MGKLSDVARAAASQVGLGPLRRWIQATSDQVDQLAIAPRSTPGLYSCPTNVAVGDAVYVSGANTVGKALATADGTLPAIGFVTDKPSGTTCHVQYSDELDLFSGLTAGATYYVSTTNAGVIVATTGVPGQFKQQVGVAKDSNTLVITVGEAFLIGGI